MYRYIFVVVSSEVNYGLRSFSSAIYVLSARIFLQPVIISKG